MKPRTPLSETEKERAKTLHASGKTVHATARALGRSPHTLKRFLRSPETAKMVDVQREELAGMFDNVAHRTLRAVSDKDIEKSSLQQKMVSAGIAIDKAAMLRGELPAAINVSVLLSVARVIRGDEEPAIPQMPALLPHEPA